MPVEYESRYNTVVLPPVSWSEPAEAHIARHGVKPHEVEEVLYGKPRYIASGRLGTRLVFGTTGSGRGLLVVVGDAPDGGLSVVTARDMTKAEQKTFRKKGG